MLLLLLLLLLLCPCTPLTELAKRRENHAHTSIDESMIDAMRTNRIFRIRSVTDFRLVETEHVTSSDAWSLPARTPDYKFSLFQRCRRSPSVVRASQTMTCSQCYADARSSSASRALAHRQRPGRLHDARASFVL